MPILIVKLMINHGILGCLIFRHSPILQSVRSVVSRTRVSFLCVPMLGLLRLGGWVSVSGFCWNLWKHFFFNTQWTVGPYHVGAHQSLDSGILKGQECPGFPWCSLEPQPGTFFAAPDSVGCIKAFEEGGWLYHICFIGDRNDKGKRPKKQLFFVFEATALWYFKIAIESHQFS